MQLETRFHYGISKMSMIKILPAVFLLKNIDVCVNFLSQFKAHILSGKS